MNALQNFLTAVGTVGLIILISAYIYFKYQYKYFKKVNIKYLTPKFPLGNIKLSFFLKFGQEIKVLHEEIKKQNVKLGGYFILMKPVVMLVHPDIFKNIFIKDFKYFQDRGIYYKEKEFITHNLVTMNGDKWKPIRPKLTTLFSTGNLKNMTDVMAEKTKDIDRRLDQILQTSSSFATKDLTGRIIIEFVCSVLYGIETNSIKNPKAEFPDYGLQIVRNNFYHTVKLIFANVLPFIFSKLQINFIKTDVQNFLINAFGEAIEYREKHSVYRKDLLNLLLKMKNDLADEDNEKLTKEQLIAQCFVFFLGGFNTSSTATSFCLFELTQNEEIQNKLRQDIRFVLNKHQNKISYEAVNEMKYLDKVVSETLRKYPSIIIINRKCVHDYNVPGTNSIIKKGNSVMISLLGLHHDPEFYPDPEKFDPERFSEEEKAKRHPHAYFPFGDGPRGCIAQRFGLLQTKISLIALLKNYKYTLSPKTILPLKFKTDSVFLVTEEEILIDVAKI